MRTNFQRCEGVPVLIVLGQNVGRARSADVEDPGQQEILEYLVARAERAGVPAEAVERDGMRRDPAPLGPRVGQGLILHFDRLRSADRVDHRPKGCGIDAARRCRGGVVGRQSRDPAIVVIEDAVGD